MKFLDIKTNSLVTDETDIERKVASGEYAAEKGVELTVTSPDGTRGKIPGENASKAFSQGFKYVSQKQLDQEAKEKEYGEGLGNEVAAGALGVARGVSFGLSDQALTGMNLIKPEALKLYRDLNPGSSLLGEVAGTVGPALLSGGTSLIAKGAAKTLPALAMKAGLSTTKMVGKKLTGKVASKSVSKIVASAAKVGAGSAVEGALYGTGQLISEEALGDAEFSAENLLSYAGKGALVGGAVGGIIPVIGAGAKKALGSTKRVIDKTILKNMGITQSQADDIVNKNVSDELLNEITEKVKNGNFSKVKKASEILDVAPTKGMLSESKLIGDLESSLSQAPTMAGKQVRKEVDAVYSKLSDTVEDTLSAKTNLTKFEAGEAIKKNLLGDLGEKLDKAKAFYQGLSDEFGDAAVSTHIKTMLKNKLNKSDANRLFKSSEVGRVNSMIDEIATINDAKKVRTYIGKELSAAHRAGDYNRVEFLDDAYESLTRLRENAIVENAGNSAEIIAGLKEANKTYSSVFKDFGAVSKTLKLGKVRNINQLAESLNGLESEKIAERFLSTKNFSGNQKLKELFPESFETSRKIKLAEIYEKSQTKGDISLRKFVTNLKKLGREETDLIFGAEKRETLEALETLVNSIPDKVGPSGTAQAQDLFNFFSVATQGRDLARLALYRRGEKGINKYLNNTLDVFKQIEKSNNETKKLVSHSFEGFLQKVKPNITVATLNAGESNNYQKALEYITEFEADPDGTLEKITKENFELFDNAPATSEAMSGKVMQRYQFLKEKAPPSFDNMSYFRTYEPSKSAKSKFMRYYNYATNPRAVFNEIEKGFVNPEAIETLRVLYPKMYGELYDEATSRIGETKNLTYPQKRNLYSLLSIVGEASLMPENLKILQGTGQQPQEKKDNGLRVAGLDKVSQSSRFSSKLDKSINR